MDKKILKKVTAKKEFSKLPKKDVELAFSHFEKCDLADFEKVKKIREFLFKVFGAFGGKKLLNIREKDFEWVLRKHLSTRERIGNYEDIYGRIFNEFRRSNKKINVVDLGAGVNGFSYPYFKNLGLNVNYFAIESVGQFVNLTNYFFEKEKINGKSFHFSLFEKEKVLGLLKKINGTKIVFLFKVLDCLEMVKKNYSKELISDIFCECDRIVLSFSTKSMIKREKFRAKRTWILRFVKENFNLLDDFEAGGERFLIFENKVEF